MDAFAAYTEYMMGMIAERKAEPTDDLVSVLVHAEVDGEKLADHEIVTEVLLLLIGGDETTRHTLSGGTAQLLRHPDQHQRLVNDLALLPNAIEEMLRWTVAGEEHGPHHHRRHRVPRHRSSSRARRSSCCSSRRTSTRRCSAIPESFDIDRYPEQPSGVRLRHPLLSGQSAGPPGAVDDAASGCCKRLPDLRLASDDARCRCGRPTSSAAWSRCR